MTTPTPASTAAPVSHPRLAAVGVDWGTTHRRGYAIGSDGTCLAEHADGDGMLAARGRFAASLHQLLKALGADTSPIPVLMAGMVGSAHGWVEVPYLAAPLALSSLGDHLFKLPARLWDEPAPSTEASRGTAVRKTRRRLHIVPGCVLRADRVDVMRGEETQLLGAVTLGHRDGWFLLPGTHSKWVRLRQGVIVDFSTYLTGELFALLSQHGTLAAAVANAPNEHDPQAFAQGLRAAGTGALSSALFGCRARVVSGAMPSAQARSYLSGLLIGAEWHDVRQRGRGRLPATVTVIGAPELAARHAEAARHFGVSLTHIDPRDAALAAFTALAAGSP
jgi:2-dehydro-3-deoxygalactonokinase